MKKFTFLILFSSQIISQDLVQDFSFDPFKSKSKINYSLNDLSNYPIGIFSINDKYLKYEVSFEESFERIVISEKILNGLKPYFEEHHDIRFTHDAIKTAELFCEIVNLWQDVVGWDEPNLTK